MRDERDRSRCWGAGTLLPQLRPVVWLNGVGDAGPRLHPSSTMTPLPSPPSQHQAQLSRETPMEKPALRSSPRVQGHGARSITGIQTLHCICLPFPASPKPFPPLDVVAGKPKQTSLKPLPHDKDRPKLCLNTSDWGKAPPKFLEKTKTRSKTPKPPAEISYLVLLG